MLHFSLQLIYSSFFVTLHYCKTLIFGGYLNLEILAVKANSAKIHLSDSKKLDGFYFSVISLFLRNATYHRSIFIALVYVHHKHLFSTRLSFQITLYTTKYFGIFWHERSYRLVLFLANCYVSTVIAKENS